MIAYTFNPRTWETDADRSLEFKDRLVYKASSGIARATQRNLVFKKETRRGLVRGEVS